MTTRFLQASEDVLRLVPSSVAAHYSVFPLRFSENTLCLAASPVLSGEDKETLRVFLGKTLEFILHEKEIINVSVARAYGLGAHMVADLTQERELSQDEEVIDLKPSQGTEESGLIEWVNGLLEDAVMKRASDIHIEPFENMLRIRYRVDGLLQEAHMPQKIHALAQPLISRFKIMSKLDIGERRLPQDGRIKIKTKSEFLDLRISVVPSAFGEAIVIRILKPLELLHMHDLGFESKITTKLNKLIQKPHGVILITGPTGSGKTTTLYACLKELNAIERKIITIEDPIEYRLPGILQMQVNMKAGLTFARALRSILRHDPDSIMIGEIRDSETAEIAIRSALTGHLVLSTLHTNDASSAATRLIEMGIEPYLVAASLRGVLAQRLVRRFCADCQSANNKSDCERCGGKGFYGRIAVSELMVVDPVMEDLILSGAEGSVLRKAAIQSGMESLYDDGLSKVQNRRTSLEEVERIISG